MTALADGLTAAVFAPSNVVDVLRWRAEQQPEEQAYVFLRDGETIQGSLTYRELHLQAQAIACRLQSLGFSGERALLLYPPGLGYIAAFFGCLYAGVVAVPTYPPRLNRSLSRLQAIVADARATVALIPTAIPSQIEQRLGDARDLVGLHWLATDGIADEPDERWRGPPLGPHTLAFLQYTSGSTTTPKGVIVSHGNLLHNLAAIHRSFRLTRKSRGVIWLPPYHDMGLIGGILQPLYGGFPVTLMSPGAFLQRPFRWLQAISRARATTSGGPNFAYDLCIRKITPELRETLDLSSWAVAFNGAEPIRSETLQRFAEAFAPCGFRRGAFYPCYGLAEATLIVSGGFQPDQAVVCTVQGPAPESNGSVEGRTDNGAVGTRVSCGWAMPDQKMIIVHPESRTRCRDREVGEIWVSGPSVALGYWDRPEETENTFRAYLANTGEGPFLRTGDLGFLADGELFVTGRIKDVIIIRGRNYYPQDLEAAAESSHPALEPGVCAAIACAAIAFEVSGEERLVIVQEVPRHHRALDTGEVMAAIRRALTEQFELEVSTVLLLKPGGIPKTSSGKIQRYACRTGFLDGTLAVVGEWAQDLESSRRSAAVADTGDPRPLPRAPKLRTAEAIQAWLQSRLAERLHVQPHAIDVRLPFACYGFSSVQAVSLSGELEEALGCPLPPTLLYDYPTIEALTRHLAEELGVAAAVVPADSNSGSVGERIAIIGMGCRFPGAPDLERFWRLLRNGINAITEVPADRWDVEAYYNPDPAAPGKMNTRWGGFLEQVDRFDPLFFGISPREAVQMDPQQRLLLEVAWEAMENAGQVPERLAGTRTGVFIGISNNDYGRPSLADPAEGDVYAGTGNALSIAANRLSYQLDFRGPSLAVDTACSSSLVAVHLACQSLASGEATLALAGGVNLILSPAVTVHFSKAGLMAPDGRCKPFDRQANGYVRGEGAGIVLLKRLRDALADGDWIAAVIRGSAVNQDGRSNGLTAPNRQAQEAVLREAYRRAGAPAAQVQYVEAHGTGTPLGDPIEVKALGAVLAASRPAGSRCALGSVKSNIGHLEAAAGVAGLIKVALCLEHRTLPPSLHFREPNPLIPFDDLPLRVQRALGPWPDEGQPGLAGVSSFGFGGTNAHVVVEAAPAAAPLETPVERPMHVLCLSAKSAAALRAQAGRYEAYLGDHPSASLADVCYTANSGRCHFKDRLTVVAESVEQARLRLAAWCAGPKPAGEPNGRAPQTVRPKVAFLFAGQGAQYPGMGRRLFETQPLFRKTLLHCQELLRPHLDRPLLAVLYPESTDPTERDLLNQTAYTQPALFALEYSLAELWRSWGVVPDLLLGHSVGEYVAACLAGIFSLEDGLKLIAARSRLMQALPVGGHMAAVFADEATVAAAIAPDARQVSLAAINGPDQVVISGNGTVVEAVRCRLAAAGVRSRPLAVSHAFHSPLMEPMLAAFARIAGDVRYAAARIPLATNQSGRLLDPGEVLDAAYWVRQIRQPVAFAAGVQTLARRGCGLWLEVGPAPVLVGMARRCVAEDDRHVWLASLRRGRDDWAEMLESLGSLHVHGTDVDWGGFDHDYPRRKLALPTYPFQRQRYWLDRPGERQLPAAPAQDRVQDWLYEVRWQVKARGERKGEPTPAGKGRSGWLIFTASPDLKSGSDRSGSDQAVGEDVGSALAELLAARGEGCVLIEPGASYQRLAPGRFRIDPERGEHFQRLLIELAGSRAPEWKRIEGVIYLWGLHTPAPITLESLRKAQRLGCLSVLHLVQALAKVSAQTRVWVVTRGVQLAGSTPHAVAPEQAPLWGLGKVIGLEQPALWAGLVDLDPSPAADEAVLLADEILQADGEDQMAYRDGRRYVARLVRSRPPPAGPLRLEADASYLITGGLGALGLHVARWMIDRGAKHLVLVGRRGLEADDPQTHQRLSAVQDLEALGAIVDVVQADVSDPVQLSAVFRQSGLAKWPLRGVIHAAGVEGYQRLSELGTEAFEEVLRPKLSGAWNLHQLTCDLRLDFFICFSSIASVWGSQGQGHYAAGNQFLDALAHHRRAAGLPALSVNWGPWAGGGMGSPKALATLARIGVAPMEAGDATLALNRLLGAGLTQATVVRMDWSAFKPVYEARQARPLLEQIEAGATHVAGGDIAGPKTFLRELEQAPDSQRSEILRTYLQMQVARVLKLGPEQALDAQGLLKDLGLDSLVALELKHQIQVDLGVAVPVVKFFENPDIAQLAAYLHDQLGATQLSVVDGRGKATAMPFRSPLVEIRPIRLRPPFVCVPGGLGITFYFAELAHHLGPDQPFYGLQAPGIEGEQEPFSRVEDLAVHYLDGLRRVHPNGPYFLGGHSLGAFVAFEMAQQLTGQGQEVALLALLDPLLISGDKGLILEDALLKLRPDPALYDFFKDKIALLDEQSGESESGERVAVLSEQWRRLEAKLTPWRLRIPDLLKVGKANRQAVLNYLPQVYPNWLTIFRARDGIEEDVAEKASRAELLPANSTRGWDRFSSGPLEVIDVAGDHFTMFKEPHVRALAERLRSCLDQVLGESRGAAGRNYPVNGTVQNAVSVNGRQMPPSGRMSCGEAGT